MERISYTLPAEGKSSAEVGVLNPSTSTENKRKEWHSCVETQTQASPVCRRGKTYIYLDEQTGHLLNLESCENSIYHRLLIKEAVNFKDIVHQTKIPIQFNQNAYRFVRDNILLKLEEANCTINVVFDGFSFQNTNIFLAMRCIILALTDDDYVNHCVNIVSRSIYSAPGIDHRVTNQQTESAHSRVRQQQNCLSNPSIPATIMRNNLNTSQQPSGHPQGVAPEFLCLAQNQYAMQVHNATKNAQPAIDLTEDYSMKKKKRRVENAQDVEMLENVARIESKLMRVKETRIELEQKLAAMNSSTPRLNPSTISNSQTNAHKNNEPEIVFEGKIVSLTENYMSLLEYYLEHGDMNVPNDYKARPNLGRFVSTVRHHRRQRNLDAETVARLDKVGFHWESEVLPRDDSVQLFIDLFILKEYGQTHQGITVNLDNPIYAWLAKWLKERGVRASRSHHYWSEAELMRKLCFKWESSVVPEKESRTEPSTIFIREIDFSSTDQRQTEPSIPSLVVSSGQREPLRENELVLNEQQQAEPSIPSLVVLSGQREPLRENELVLSEQQQAEPSIPSLVVLSGQQEPPAGTWQNIVQEHNQVGKPPKAELCLSEEISQEEIDDYEDDDIII